LTVLAGAGIARGKAMDFRRAFGRTARTAGWRKG